MKERIKRDLIFFSKLLIVLILLGTFSLLITVNVSPILTVCLLKHNFDKEPIKPKEYRTYAKEVAISSNVKYQSKYKNSNFDIYTHSGNKSRPTIIWVHGGAFVAGDKADVRYWSMKMADNGYNVVAINYALSPGNHYPDQVKQTSDAIRAVVANYHKKLNVRKIVIGGDSAGAHIASQLIAAQSNQKLARKLGYQRISNTEIVGALLYCGPYDIAKISNQHNQSFLTRFFINQLGWAYLGKKDWQAVKMSKYVSTIKYVNGNFPATFITDGNTGSFESQGKELYKQLQEKKVPAKALFFGNEHKIGHEYQFDLDTQVARKCFKETLSFLQRL